MSRFSWWLGWWWVWWLVCLGINTLALHHEMVRHAWIESIWSAGFAVLSFVLAITAAKRYDKKREQR